MSAVRLLDQSRPVIMCFVAHYLPGFRSGGPVRTIANLVEHLGDEFDIRIVTRDRDALDFSSYPDVTVDCWNTVGNAQVFYASPKMLNWRSISKILNETPHEILYLNSFFAWSFTGVPLLVRRLGLAPKVPCVIAPRGEFSQGAITLKATKKRLYLSLAKLVGLYEHLTWQASSALEAQDILREFGENYSEIVIAPNLPPKLSGALNQRTFRLARRDGPLRLVFLSRISPKKNLDFLLAALKNLTICIDLNIFGPVRDLDYWTKCKELIGGLPHSVSVNYSGEVEPCHVVDKLRDHDLFIFPTRGENYGHVILESLRAGTPVLLSDQTPWRESGDGAIEVLPLDELSLWTEAIERWASLEDLELAERRTAATSYAEKYFLNTEIANQNRSLFLSVLMKENLTSSISPESDAV